MSNSSLISTAVHIVRDRLDIGVLQPSSKRIGLLELQWRGRRLIIAPWAALRYFAICILFLLAIAAAAEFFLKRECSRFAVNCPEIERDLQFTHAASAERFKSDLSNPLWTSPGMPFSPAQPGRRRILVIGDSFAYGHGVKNINQVWWRQLQRELEHRGYWNLDVIALGANGASTQDQTKWIADSRLMDSIKPDLILLGYVSNDPDIVDSAGNRLIKQYKAERWETCLNGWLASSLRWFPHLGFELSAKCVSRDIAMHESEELGYGYSSWESQLLRADNLRLYERIVRNLAESAKRWGVDLVAVTMPAQIAGNLDGSPALERVEQNAASRIDSDSRFANVAPIFKRVGAVWWDLYPDFVRRFLPSVLESGRYPPGMHVSPADGHPGPLLTRFYAVRVADRLEREFPASLGERGAPPLLAPKINDWLPVWLDPRETQAGAWTFSADQPAKPTFELAPYIRHGMLSFERPVMALAFSFESSAPFKIRLWAHVIDESDGHTSSDPIEVGAGEGTRVTIDLPASLRTRRISSLLVAAQMIDQRIEFDWQLKLDPKRLLPETGSAYIVVLGDIPYGGGSNQIKSELALYEDGRLLGPSGAFHDTIRSVGKGAFSHWGANLYFSTSDNSDPRRNGREYVLAHVKDTPRIKMTGQFHEPAVLP